MQPRPMAETSGPSRPSRLLPISNMFFSLLLGEPPPRLRHIKWDRDPLMTRCRARNYRQFGTPDPKSLGEQRHDAFVRSTIRRRVGAPYLQLLAPVCSRSPTADPRLR